MQNRKKGLVIALAAAIFTAAALSGCGNSSQSAMEELTVTDTTFCKGVYICGVNMEGKTKEQAISLLSHLEQDPEPFSITLTLGDEEYTYTQDDFDIDTDYVQAVEDVYDYLHYGSAKQYYGKKLVLSKESRNFGAVQTINQKSLTKKLTELADKLTIEAQEPTVIDYNGKTFTFSDGKNGRSINTKKLISDVEEALKISNNVTVEIESTVTKPEHKKSDYDGVMEKLGTFSTVSTNNENGNHNMKLALDYVNGTTIGPGETFSFNTIVGDSTNGSRGFVKAGVIVNGKLQDDYGGGICQASTTIYGAAIRSNLTIVERYNHMWPSTYVPIGQDAAVDYGIQDFQFRNDTDYPIYIQAGMSGTKLTVTIYGYQSPEYDTIEVTSKQTGTLEVPKPTYKEDDSLKKGEIETERESREGKTASAQRIYYKDGKVVKTESLPDSYYPSIGAIYRYGPGTKIDS